MLMQILEEVGVGDIEILAFNGQECCWVTLKNVLYAPERHFNLFS